MSSFLSFIIRVSLLFILSTGKRKKRWRQPKCGNTHHFRFDEELPTFHDDLSYCKYYRGDTCCNRTHTDKIIHRVYSYHDPNISDACRSIGVNVGCSPCDPRIGTNQMNGICEGYCEEWYNACSDDFFHYNKRGLLSPCLESDDVCSTLSSIVSNGTELCQQSGFETSYISINCYNGIKSKFKPLPTVDSYPTPFHRMWNTLRNDPGTRLFVKRLTNSPWWVKLLMLVGSVYSIYSIIGFLINICSRCCGSNDVEVLSSSYVEGQGLEEFVREQRLKALMKEQSIEQSKNMEAALAKQLGMDFNFADNNGDDDDDGKRENIPEFDSGVDNDSESEDSDNAEE